MRFLLQCLVALMIMLVGIVASAQSRPSIPSTIRAVEDSRSAATRKIIESSVMFSVMMTMPPFVGIFVGLARPDAAINVPMGIGIAAVTLASSSACIANLVLAIQQRYETHVVAVLPMATSAPDGTTVVGVAGVF